MVYGRRTVLGTLTYNTHYERVNMSTLRNSSNYSVLPLTGAALALSAASLLGGCTAQVGVAAPPPPRVYIAPPPPPPPPPPATYAEPVVDVEVHATEAPPPLPDYEQPPCPEEGYLWTPGYWAWGAGGYYWVPGTWVQPPRVGVLWTPGYWGFVGGVYAFHAGYWGPHVGFYGGVNYGFGYVGVGFAGGHWAGNSFAYNRTVTNINVTNVHNTYNETVINNVTVNKVSYNGGAGGIAAAPTAQERAAAQESHVAPTQMQRQHIQEAAKNPALAARTNGGHPAIAATPKPGAFNAPGVVHARGAVAAPEHAPVGSPALPARSTGPTTTATPHVNNGNQTLQPKQNEAVHAPTNTTLHPQPTANKLPASKPPQQHQQQHPKPQEKKEPNKSR